MSCDVSVDDELEVLFVVHACDFARELDVFENVTDPIVEVVAVRRDVVAEDSVFKHIEDCRKLRDVLDWFTVGQDEVLVRGDISREVVHAHARDDWSRVRGFYRYFGRCFFDRLLDGFGSLAAFFRN